MGRTPSIFGGVLTLYVLINPRRVSNVGEETTGHNWHAPEGGTGSIPDHTDFIITQRVRGPKEWAVDGSGHDYVIDLTGSKYVISGQLKGVSYCVS